MAYNYYTHDDNLISRIYLEKIEKIIAVFIAVYVLSKILPFNF